MLGYIIYDDEQIDHLNTREDFEKIGVNFDCDYCNIIEFKSIHDLNRLYGLRLEFFKDKGIFSLIVYFDIIQRRDIIIEIFISICFDVGLVFSFQK